MRTLHPAAFGGRVIFCCQAPWCLMLSMESMIKIQAAGAGEDGRPFPSRFPEKFCAICRSFHVPETRAVLQRVRPRGRETGGVRYRVLRIATGAVRPRNDNSQEVWRGRTGSSAPTDAFRKCVGEGLCHSRGRGRTPPLRRTEKIVCDCFGIYISRKMKGKKK